ncbi:hypothetical protein TNCV_1969981 [Trichonephila clavipes]|nr:hypothetical protein TNCV_1969981 [Trichonephila clavipes]
MYPPYPGLATGSRKESVGATEISRNITTCVIELDTSGEIYYFLEDSRGFRTRQHGRQNSHQIGLKNDANLALPPRFRQVVIESPL